MLKSLVLIEFKDIEVTHPNLKALKINGVLEMNDSEIESTFALLPSGDDMEVMNEEANGFPILEDIYKVVYEDALNLELHQEEEQGLVSCDECMQPVAKKSEDASTEEVMCFCDNRSVCEEVVQVESLCDDRSDDIDFFNSLLSEAGDDVSPLTSFFYIDFADAPYAADASDQNTSDRSNQPSNMSIVKVPKMVVECPIPGTRKTHEICAVNNDLLLITQQASSTLIEIQLSRTTGRRLSYARFRLGDFWAGLHGLGVSQIFPNQVWTLLQFKFVITRIEPELSMFDVSIVRQVITLPSFTYRPHCVCECGPDAARIAAT
ncbi:hypothetical protein L7F22_012875 [Adiantum nelumboides]|nr:hypothetical protein [Adiantum nelumboides]